MRIKHHYYLQERAGLLNFLNRNGILYKISDDLPGMKNRLCTFDLYEDQEEYMKFKKQFFWISKYNSIKSIEYSKKDIENAEWFSIRSKSTKVQWEYEEKAFKETCSYKRPFMKELYYRHSEQIGILSANKTVKWGTRQYFSGPNAADDLLFCSEKAKKLLGDKWLGLEFWPVRKYNSSEYISDLFQLFFTDTLPIEAITGGKSTTCNTCGKRIVRFKDGIHQLELKREFLRGSSKVYKTGDVLTEQIKGGETFSINIVSQEFYQYCEKNQMNRGMIYEPIKLV